MPLSVCHSVVEARFEIETFSKTFDLTINTKSLQFRRCCSSIAVNYSSNVNTSVGSASSFEFELSRSLNVNDVISSGVLQQGDKSSTIHVKVTFRE